MGLTVILALGLAGWTCPGVGVAARVEVSAGGEIVVGQFPDGVRVIREGKVSGVVAHTPSTPISNFALSRDGKRLAVLRPEEAELFDTVSMRSLGSLRIGSRDPGRSIYLGAFSLDNQSLFLVSGSLYHNWLYEVETKSGRVRRTLINDADGRASSIRFSPNGRYMAIDLAVGPNRLFEGRRAPHLTAFDLRSGKAVSSYEERPLAFEFDEKSERVLVQEQARSSFLSVVPVTVSSRPFRDLTFPFDANRPASFYAFQPGTDRIVFASGRELVGLNANGEKRVIFEGLSEIRSFAFSPDGRFVAVGNAAGDVRLKAN
jgi:dipeptidyl aminopeptidase/acylaminoacyl peptidase